MVVNKALLDPKDGEICKSKLAVEREEYYRHSLMELERQLDCLRKENEGYLRELTRLRKALNNKINEHKNHAK